LPQSPLTTKPRPLRTRPSFVVPARHRAERGLDFYRGDARDSGGDDDDVPAAERGTPQCDPIWVHALEAAGKEDGRAPVLELAPALTIWRGSLPLSPKLR
jgi:hypothetical protein